MKNSNDIPIGNRLDILQSAIRALEREKARLIERRDAINRSIEELDCDIAKHKSEWDDLTVGRVKV